MPDISSRLLPLVEFVYASAEEADCRPALAQALANALEADRLTWRISPTANRTVVAEFSSHRIMERARLWPGAEVEVEACRDDHAPPFAESDRRVLVAIMPHLCRAFRLRLATGDATLRIADRLLTPLPGDAAQWTHDGVGHYRRLRFSKES